MGFSLSEFFSRDGVVVLSSNLAFLPVPLAGYKALPITASRTQPKLLLHNFGGRYSLRVFISEAFSP
jgi:hypothetical protein